MINKDLFEILCDMADKKYDGHFTLMKFTTDWRCSFGTVHGGFINQGGVPVSEVSGMASGQHVNEVIRNCVIREIRKL